MSTTDSFDLERFVAAQAPVWKRVMAELAAAQKESHWMWFVFPQLLGLGRSAMAERYGIASRAEAAAYLAHPLLGPRLVEATHAMLAAPFGLSALAILGAPDDVKFRSSMTLFAAVADRDLGPFGAALARYFGGASDPATIALLGGR
jgi:uncharacterized protein (DUF1810 family)